VEGWFPVDVGAGKSAKGCGWVVDVLSFEESEFEEWGRCCVCGDGYDVGLAVFGTLARGGIFVFGSVSCH
jgi:hypothetical protein